MRTVITTFLRGPGRGVITTDEARRAGCSPAALRSLVRDGTLVRAARGVYVSAALLDPAPADAARLGAPAAAEQRHLLLLDAVLRSYGKAVAASHQSAVLAWGLPTVWTTLDRIHVVHTSPGRTARRHDSFHIHTCELTDVITHHGGRRVVVPPLAVVGAALSSGLVAGVVAMDGALRAGRTTRQEIDELLGRMRHTPGLSAARAALDLADGLAESPGESRLRILLTRLGIEFVAQHWVRTSAGRHYRVDFYLPALGVVLEYDGRVKYAGDAAGLDGDRSGQEALLAEKRREDDLRLDGFGVGRVTASGLTARAVRQTVSAAGRQARPSAVGRASEPPPWAGRA